MFVHPRGASSHDLYWLAGLLEGEGSFLPGSPSAPHRPTIQLEMIDEDVMARVGRLVGPKVITCKARRPEWSASYAIRIRGAEAVAWMRALRPLLGRRRQVQVERALRTYAPKSRQRLYDKSALEALILLEGEHQCGQSPIASV